MTEAPLPPHLPPPLTEAQTTTAGEISRVVLNRLRGDDGVQAEVAISTTARMSGTYLLRSLGVRMGDLEAGTAIFTDEAGLHGPILVATIRSSLIELECPLDAARIPATVPEANRSPHSIMQTQLMFGIPFRQTIRRNGLSEGEAAYAIALAVARLIKDCSPVLDPHIAYAIAEAGCLEGARTVPLVLPGDDEPDSGKPRPWYKFW